MFVALVHRPDALVMAMPWGLGLAIARALIFSGMALTLLVNPATVLFTPSAAQPDTPVCDAYNSWSMFCLAGASLDVARIITGTTMLICATGLLPWLTALPGAYVVLSFSTTTTLGDGGDQLYGILALLLLPISTTDWRRSSWHHGQSRRAASVRGALALAGWAVVRAQVFVVYFEAAVGKLAVPEWANGTALYYWMRSPTFGPGEFLAPTVQALTALSVVTALATFGTIALEFCLAIGPLFTLRLRRLLLILGLLFHGAIVVFMGITSFSIVMAAALFLHLPPLGCGSHSLFPGKRYRFGGDLRPVS